MRDTVLCSSGYSLPILELCARVGETSPTNAGGFVCLFVVWVLLFFFTLALEMTLYFDK